MQEKLRLHRSDIARAAGSAYYCHAERGNITELAKLNITLLKAEYHLPERQISLWGGSLVGRRVSAGFSKIMNRSPGEGGYYDLC